MTLKKDDRYHRILLSIFCMGILVLYFVTTYICMIPSSLTALCCMTLPSLILFYHFSKYKDGRFFLIFFVVVTATLTIGFIGRWIVQVSNNKLGLIVLITTCLLFTFLFIKIKPFIHNSREILKVKEEGWDKLALISFLIYLTLIFSAIYPKPLAMRIEYGPSYLLLCLVVISCYYILIQSLLKTKIIYQQNMKLKQEQKYHHIAFTDSLTGLANRASYVEYIEKLERNKDLLKSSAIIVFDLNHFKEINDLKGHQMGDKVLISFAHILKEVFVQECFHVYRLGGDEFVVISTLVSQNELECFIDDVDRQLLSYHQLEVSYGVAHGVAFYDYSHDSIEKMFAKADEKMYHAKQSGR